MPIRLPLRRIIPNLNLAVHLTIHTADCIIAATVHTWRERHRPRRRPVTMRHQLVKMLRYYVGCAVDGRDSFRLDGDFDGRRPSQLHPQLRRQRRELADRRRRQVTVLLNALGDTPDAVQASLTRHWQLAGDDLPDHLVEDCLASRLVHRDRHALLYVVVSAWACNVGGTWIATPSAIRRYLSRAPADECCMRPGRASRDAAYACLPTAPTTGSCWRRQAANRAKPKANR